MEYKISVNLVKPEHCDETRMIYRVRSYYQPSPKEWIGKWVMTIFGAGYGDQYMWKVKQQLFNTEDEALKEVRRFIESRRKDTDINFEIEGRHVCLLRDRNKELERIEMVKQRHTPKNQMV